MRLDFSTKVSFKFDYIFIEQCDFSESVSFTEFADEVIEQFSSDCLNSTRICNTIKSDVDYLLQSVIGGNYCDYDIKSMEVSCITSESTITLNGSINFEFYPEAQFHEHSFGNVMDVTHNFKQYIEDEIVEYGEIVDSEPLYRQLDEDDPIRFTFEYKIESCESKLIKE